MTASSHWSYLRHYRRSLASCQHRAPLPTLQRKSFGYNKVVPALSAHIFPHFPFSDQTQYFLHLMKWSLTKATSLNLKRKTISNYLVTGNYQKGMPKVDSPVCSADPTLFCYLSDFVESKWSQCEVEEKPEFLGKLFWSASEQVKSDTGWLMVREQSQDTCISCSKKRK